MKQISLKELHMKKQIRVVAFLKEMDDALPWHDLLTALTPFYKTGENGRSAYPLETMLRIHFLQLWYNLSDPAIEEALYDRSSFQQFVGLDGFTMPPPDETTICRFRHFLEKNQLAELLFNTVNEHLDRKGLVLKSGTIVDATLLEAPVSKKNESRQRDPEMSSTKKNNKWHFGAKGHIGVQANGKPIIHSVAFTTAKEADINAMDALLHGEEQAVFGDSGYTKQEDKVLARGLEVFYGILDRGSSGHPLSSSQKKRNKRHSRLRAKVEHPFRIIKVLWNQSKLRYKGLAKNASRFLSLCGLCNIYLCRKLLIA